MRDLVRDRDAHGDVAPEEMQRAGTSSSTPSRSNYWSRNKGAKRPKRGHAHGSSFLSLMMKEKEDDETPAAAFALRHFKPSTFLYMFSYIFFVYHSFLVSAPWHKTRAIGGARRRRPRGATRGRAPETTRQRAGAHAHLKHDPPLQAQGGEQQEKDLQLLEARAAGVDCDALEDEDDDEFQDEDARKLCEELRRRRNGNDEDVEADGASSASSIFGYATGSTQRLESRGARVFVTAHAGGVNARCNCTLTCDAHRYGEGFEDPQQEVFGRRIPEALLTAAAQPKQRIGYSVLTSCRRWQLISRLSDRLRAVGVEPSDIYVFLARCNPNWIRELAPRDCQLIAQSGISLIPFVDGKSYTECGTKSSEHAVDQELGAANTRWTVKSDWGLDAFPLFSALYSGIAKEKKPIFFDQWQNVVQSHPKEWKDAEFRMRIYLIWTLAVMFMRYDFVVSLQDNIELSPKAPEFFSYCTRVMKVDNSVIGATGWNFLQINEKAAGALDNNLYVLRQSHFGNIAWLTSREVFVNLLLPFASLSDWMRDGDWSPLMRRILVPNKNLHALDRFTLWGAELKALDKKLVEKHLAPTHQYKIHDAKDTHGLLPTRVTFLLPSISVVRHSSQSNEEGGKKKGTSPELQSMISRAAMVAFWALENPVHYPDPAELVAWKFDHHYLMGRLLGAKEAVEEKRVNLWAVPHSENDTRGVLAKWMGDWLVKRGYLENVTATVNNTDMLPLHGHSLFHPPMKKQVTRTLVTKYGCARFSCEAGPKNDNDSEGWAAALTRFDPGLLVQKSTYKGTILLQHGGYRWLFIARYSPFWEMLDCA